MNASTEDCCPLLFSIEHLCILYRDTCAENVNITSVAYVRCEDQEILQTLLGIFCVAVRNFGYLKCFPKNIRVRYNGNNVIWKEVYFN